MKKILFILFCFFATSLIAGDSVTVKVHFLYGSKPKKAFRKTKDRWFGGKLGGHVGIERKTGTVVDFVPSGGLHYFAHRRNRYSKFAVRNPESFWSIFGEDPDSVKKATVYVKMSKAQAKKLDSIIAVYTSKTPYDYAFFGMRCGAAAQDILGETGVLKDYGYRRTWIKTFWPRKVRKRLFKKAKKNHWKIVMSEGCGTRNWERD